MPGLWLLQFAQQTLDQKEAPRQTSLVAPFTVFQNADAIGVEPSEAVIERRRCPETGVRVEFGCAEDVGCPHPVIIQDARVCRRRRGECCGDGDLRG